MIFKETPIQGHTIKGTPILVKREDMAVPAPGPPFSKVRGIIPALTKFKKKGYDTICYTETSVSMAGWGVAWACSELGLKAVIYDPQYKKTPGILKHHRKQWKKFNAVIIPVKAGMAKVNYYISRKHMNENYENGYLLPLGLPFEESIDATAVEMKKTIKKYKPGCIVINIGSGTICAGVLRESKNIPVYGVMGRTGNVPQKLKSISTKSKVILDGLLKSAELILIDPGWEYTQKSETKCPFPCHPWYDLKAWEWLKENAEKLPSPILFWNIGRM